jgi:AraC-like DNA-binding protein
MFVSRPPSPPLRPFVERLWYFEDELAHSRERSLPSGSIQLLVNLHEDALRWYEAGLPAVHSISGAGVCGPFSRPIEIDTAEQRAIVGVSFRPGGASPFFTAPAYAMSDTHVDLRDLWGQDGRLLRERLLECATPEAMISMLEGALVRHASGPLARDQMVVLALGALEHGAGVAGLCERFDVPRTKFVSRFRRHVGLAPKRYSRVRRFQRTIRAMVEDGQHDYAGLAAEYGYHDQAHFVHEFRSFAGTTPAHYRPRSAGELNHLPLDR